MPQHSTTHETDLRRSEILAASSREVSVNAHHHRHEKMVANLMAAREGKTLRAVADMADDFGLSYREALEAVEEVGDGFAPDPTALHIANEASEDAPKR